MGDEVRCRLIIVKASFGQQGTVQYVQRGVHQLSRSHSQLLQGITFSFNSIDSITVLRLFGVNLYSVRCFYCVLGLCVSFIERYMMIYGGKCLRKGVAVEYNLIK